MSVRVDIRTPRDPQIGREVKVSFGRRPGDGHVATFDLKTGRPEWRSPAGFARVENPAELEEFVLDEDVLA